MTMGLLTCHGKDGEDARRLVPLSAARSQTQAIPTALGLPYMFDHVAVVMTLAHFGHYAREKAIEVQRRTQQGQATQSNGPEKAEVLVCRP